MAEEFDINELANQASTKQATELQHRKSFLTKLIVAIVVTVIIVGSGSWLAYIFFARTDFSKNVPLSESISQWDPLYIYFGANVTTITNSYGIWKDTNDSGTFNNSENGCLIKVIPLGSGITGKEGNDAEATNSLGSSIGGTPSDSVWIPVENSEGKVEFASKRYTSSVNDTQQPTIAYFRVLAKSGQNPTIAISCKDQSTLDAINSSLVKDFDLGISLTRSNKLVGLQQTK